MTDKEGVNKKDLNKPVLTVNGKSVALKTKKERDDEARIAKEALDKKLASGEIDGAEYNQELIKIRTPEEYKPKRNKKIIIGLTISFIFLFALIVLPIAITLNWHYYYQNSLSTVDLPDYSRDFSLDVEKEPVQIVIDGQKNGQYRGRSIAVEFNDYYDISGVVTSIYDYRGFDDYSALVPRDVCLAWGDLVTSFKKGEVQFSQFDRSCTMRDDLKDDEEGVDSSEDKKDGSVFGKTFGNTQTFSNNHLIPSSIEIRDKIWGLNTGDKVRIIGYLVNVKYGSMTLSSSVSRGDLGSGASEVIYVTNIVKEAQK